MRAGGVGDVVVVVVVGSRGGEIGCNDDGDGEEEEEEEVVETVVGASSRCCCCCCSDDDDGGCGIRRLGWCGSIVVFHTPLLISVIFSPATTVAKSRILSYGTLARKKYKNTEVDVGAGRCHGDRWSRDELARTDLFRFTRGKESIVGSRTHDNM